jgi:uncharacterized protein (TIGR00369 family)
MTDSAVKPLATAAYDSRSLDTFRPLVRGAGLVIDNIGESVVTGHIDLDSGYRNPWGVVHGEAYSAAVESAASLGASAAVVGRGHVAVGFIYRTVVVHPLTGGRVDVKAQALYQGQTHQIWRVDIFDEARRLVAHGEVRFQNVEPPES